MPQQARRLEELTATQGSTAPGKDRSKRKTSTARGADGDRTARPAASIRQKAVFDFTFIAAVQQAGFGFPTYTTQPLRDDLRSKILRGTCRN
jgi:hypothetical protein